MIQLSTTVADQVETQNTIDELYEPYMNDAELLNGLELHRNLHRSYLLKGLEHLSSGYMNLDASKPWICYWIVHSLDLLGYPLGDELKDRIVNTLAACQHPQGGFGGGPNQLPHLACTFAAVSTLAILETVEAYEIIDRPKLLSFLLQMKQSNGGFTVHQDGEMDVRGSYCAVAVSSLTGLLTQDIRANVAEFIKSCQSYEGGIGAIPFAEAHSGYTYCGVAALTMLDQLDTIDVRSLERFATMSQCPESGGFRGRTHKLVDGCYSFWTGALFQMLRRYCPTTYFDSLALQKYLLVCSQNDATGGLVDKPGKSEDYYHTCYCLSGLSIAQRETRDKFSEGELEDGIVLGDAANLLYLVAPEFNLRPKKVKSIQQFFR